MDTINKIIQINTLVAAGTNFYNDLARPEEFKTKYFSFAENLNDDLVGMEFFTSEVISPMDIWESENDINWDTMNLKK